jgi:aspartate carbamoyltransferase catalytic subunit
MKVPARGSLLGIEHLDAKEILRLLALARRMNPQRPRPLLRGKRIVLLFYEASTPDGSCLRALRSFQGRRDFRCHKRFGGNRILAFAPSLRYFQEKLIPSYGSSLS